MDQSTMVLLFVVTAWAMGGSYLIVNAVDTDVVIAIETKLVTDLVTEQNITTNIICISPHRHIDILTKLDWGNNTRIFIDYGTVNTDIIRKVQGIHIVDNKPLLYIIIPPILYMKDRLWDITSDIRSSVDQHGRIVVIHQKIVMFPKDVYNIYMLFPIINSNNALTKYIMYEVCKYCDMGKDSIVLSNTWQVGSGFLRKLLLTPSFKGSFNSAVLKLGCTVWCPTSCKIGQDTDGKDVWDGKGIRQYNMIANMAKAQMEYMEPEDGNEYSLVSRDGTAVGSLRDMYRGNVSLVGCGWRGTYNRYKASDFGAYHHVNPQEKIISMRPDKGIKWYGIVQSFSWLMWTCTVITCPVVGFTLYWLRRLESKPDKKACLLNDLWDSAVMFLWEGIIFHRNAPISTYLLLGSYSFSVLILIYSYMGDLAGCLVAQRYVSPPIDSFDQLWRSDFKLLSFGALVANYRNMFKHVDDIDKKIIKIEFKLGIEHPYYKMAQIFAADKDKYVLIGPEGAYNRGLNKHAPELLYKLYASKEGKAMTYMYIMYLPSFPEKEIINRNILHMHATYLMQMVHVRYVIESGEYGKLLVQIEWNKPKEKMKLATLKELKLAFFMIIFFSCFAFICFLFEIFWHRHKVQMNVDYRTYTFQEGD